MRKISWKKYLGVTLFEMLLVLFVSSMVAVAAFKYQQEQNQTAVADPLAQRMYLFSQTVRTFVIDNQAAIANGTLNPFAPPASLPAGSTFTVKGQGANAIYTITGVSWLENLNSPGSQTPYLPKTFTFNGLNPLELRRGDLKGDDAIEVTITSTKVTIQYGVLYDLSATGKFEGSVTARAATKASKIYDPLLGVSTFSYVGGIDKNGDPLPIVATWDKTQTAETHINSPDVTGDVNVAGNFNLSPPASGAQSGGNDTPDITGVGTLAFQKGGEGAISNLNTVTFNSPKDQSAAGASGTSSTDTTGSTDGGLIDNLGTVNMVGSGEINGIQELNFGDQGGTTGTTTSGTQTAGIKGIHSIKFDGASGEAITFQSSNAQIEGLNTLAFNQGSSISGLGSLTLTGSDAAINGVTAINFPTGPFKGIVKTQGFAVFSPGKSDNDQKTVYTGYYLNKGGYCFLTMVHADWCQVMILASEQYMLQGSNGNCVALCLSFQ